ncbi:MAG TPA: hypothetical protein VFH27_00335 [Longimicrobiaceae bacterium]|nr:hypothetical protein [Longimicrobiaceae bacterium]
MDVKATEPGQPDGGQGEAGSGATDRVYGIVGVLALVLAAVFGVQMLLGGPADTGTAPPAAVAPLSIVEPADGVSSSSPLSIVIGTAAPLQMGPMGWAADGRHLHLRADSAELMAGNADIAPAGPGHYRWSVPLPPGEHTLRVYWSGADHQAMEAGASQPVRVRIR